MTTSNRTEIGDWSFLSCSEVLRGVKLDKEIAMSSYGLFSFGLTGPLILFVLGHVAIGFLFSGAAIVVRLRADSEFARRESRIRINWAIVTLAVSSLLTIVGAVFFHNADTRIGMIIAAVGVFFVWPVSTAFAILGRGAGRSVLLIGDAMIAILLIFTLLSIWIYG